MFRQKINKLIAMIYYYFATSKHSKDIPYISTIGVMAFWLLIISFIIIILLFQFFKIDIFLMKKYHNKAYSLVLLLIHYVFAFLIIPPQKKLQEYSFAYLKRWKILFFFLIVSFTLAGSIIFLLKYFNFDILKK